MLVLDLEGDEKGVVLLEDCGAVGGTGKGILAVAP